MGTAEYNEQESSGGVVSSHPRDTLRFISRQADGRIDFWSPEPVEGDWEQQNNQGVRYAHDAIAYMTAYGDIPMLPAIIRRIIERGTFGGVEVGFFTILATRLN